MESAELPIKIKSYRIRKAGGSVSVTLPRVWLDDLGLGKGDKLDIYRDTNNRLIIAPPSRSTPSDLRGLAARESGAKEGA